MKCDKCLKGNIVLHGFSHGKCIICKYDITTVHTPCDKVCKKCSNENFLCEECGVEIEKIELINRLRKSTGLCTTKCTFVLEKTNYDFEKSFNYLKENSNKF